MFENFRRRLVSCCNCCRYPLACAGIIEIIYSCFEVITLKINTIAGAVLLIAMAPAAWSQSAFRYGSDDRAGQWDMSFEIIYLDSETLSGPEDLSLAINDDWGFGFSFGYNFTGHLALGLEMNFLSPGYTLTGTPDGETTPQTLSHKMDMFNGLVKGTYNLIDGPITPFVDLSLGFSYLDSNIKDGPNYCYPDWYWGWVCFSDTHDTTKFNYGGGLGLRWDVSRDIFLRTSYSIMKIDLGNSSDLSLGMGRLEIGWRY